jgi:signal transduction histidine kinase
MAAGNITQTGNSPDEQHEFRTHLTTILGYGELLALDDLTPRQRESVVEIVAAGRRLLDLVDKKIAAESKRLEEP